MLEAIKILQCLCLQSFMWKVKSGKTVDLQIQSSLILTAVVDTSHVCILNLEIIERCYQLPPGVLTCNDTVSPQLTVTDIQLAAKSS